MSHSTATYRFRGPNEVGPALWAPSPELPPCPLPPRGCLFPPGPALHPEASASIDKAGQQVWKPRSGPLLTVGIPGAVLCGNQLFFSCSLNFIQLAALLPSFKKKGGLRCFTGSCLRRLNLAFDSQTQKIPGMMLAPHGLGDRSYGGAGVIGKRNLRESGLASRAAEDCRTAGGQHGGAGQGGVWAEAGVLCWTCCQDVVPPMPAVL